MTEKPLHELTISELDDHDEYHNPSVQLITLKNWARAIAKDLKKRIEYMGSSEFKKTDEYSPHTTDNEQRWLAAEKSIIMKKFELKEGDLE